MGSTRRGFSTVPGASQPSRAVGYFYLTSQGSWREGQRPLLGPPPHRSLVDLLSGPPFAAVGLSQAHDDVKAFLFRFPEAPPTAAGGSRALLSLFICGEQCRLGSQVLFPLETGS